MSGTSRPSPGASRPSSPSGCTHIGVAWCLPQVLREFGVDPAAAVAAAGLPGDLFDDPRNTVEYAGFQQLLSTCARLTGCEHFALLAAQGTRLADFGLTGQSALCAATAGDGLRNFVRNFGLHSTATTTSLREEGSHCRFVYAISVGGLVATAQLHLGAVTVSFNLLRELLGPGWWPSAVSFASHAPTDLRPLQRYFGAPLRFDSDESAVIFERHWLDRRLPPVDEEFRRRVETEIGLRGAALSADLPGTVRRMLRHLLIEGPARMPDVADRLGMHRRTLDRQLQRHGLRYRELLESVETDLAEQLLRDTRMPVRQVAESLRFSSAANFATAFRRWTGMTPTGFRRQQRY